MSRLTLAKTGSNNALMRCSPVKKTISKLDDGDANFSQFYSASSAICYLISVSHCDRGDTNTIFLQT